MNVGRGLLLVNARLARIERRLSRVDRRTMPGMLSRMAAVIRGTAKLLRRLKVEVVSDAPPPANRLGDWYANLLFVGREQLVLFTSAITLLPVLVPLTQSKTLVSRFATALESVLAELGGPAERIREEVAALDAVVFARTRSRQVLGSMNDFAFMFEYERRGGSQRNLREASLGLAKSPCSPIAMDSPLFRTREMLCSAGGISRMPIPKCD